MGCGYSVPLTQLAPEYHGWSGRRRLRAPGNRALIDAVNAMNEPLIEELLVLGADVHQDDDEVLRTAIRRNQLDLLVRLLQECKPERVLDETFWQACESIDSSVCFAVHQRIIALDRTSSPMWWEMGVRRAIYAGRIVTALCLVTFGGDGRDAFFTFMLPRKCDYSTCLMICADEGHENARLFREMMQRTTKPVDAIELAKICIVNDRKVLLGELLDHVSSPFVAPGWDRFVSKGRILDFAIRSERPDVAPFLCDRGCDPFLLVDSSYGKSEQRNTVLELQDAFRHRERPAGTVASA